MSDALDVEVSLLVSQVQDSQATERFKGGHREVPLGGVEDRFTTDRGPCATRADPDPVLSYR